MARIPIIAGNWKMNKTVSEATQLLQQLAYSYEDKKIVNEVETVICPPYIALRSAQVTLRFDVKSKIKLGAQDVYYQPSGAYTGAISTEMLKDLGCEYCIVGHSERREYFLETDEDIARKVSALREAAIAPIVCCGESLETRDSGETLSFVSNQITAALAHLQGEDVSSIILAYEPIWAIGTGRTPTPEQADEVCGTLRATFAELFGEEAAQKVRILYGGSMNPGNVDLFKVMPNIDGGLVGGAALNAEDFFNLVYAFAE